MLLNSKCANNAAIETKQIRENLWSISWVKEQLVGKGVSP